jgi:hypothetical protein
VTRNKKSCDLVQQAVAGPQANDVLEAIRAEYWLPARPRPDAARGSKGATRSARKDDTTPARPDRQRTQR